MLVASGLLGSALALAGYTYVGYPLLLRALCWRMARGAGAGGRAAWDGPGAAPASPALAAASPASACHWPSVTILVPVHNAAETLLTTLESLLALRYPGRRQILVVSDASTDTTDDVAAQFASRGVERIRLPVRRGKTAGENLAGAHVRGDIVVTVDASSRIPPDALIPLIAAFQDRSVGVASGRDISVASDAEAVVAPEAKYVGYEMWVRRWETAFRGIVGASGCFYAERTELYRHPVPEHLSRDFAASLVAQRQGYRAVAVDDAVCLVPRTNSVGREYRRKARTITRGIATLWHFRDLLNPARHGWFAWMLFSHKVCRWLVPWALLGALAGIALLAARVYGVTAVLLGAGVLGGVVVLGLRQRAPGWCRALTFGLAANLAVLHGWMNCWLGQAAPYWEPTRRGRPARRIERIEGIERIGGLS